MSYILDALQRSQHDREKGQIPTLDSQPFVAQKNKNLLARPLFLILLLALIVLTAVAITLTWQKSTDQPAITRDGLTEVVVETKPVPVPTPQKQVVVSKPEPARNPETAPAKPVVKPTISLPVAQAPAVAAKPSITSANKEPAATVAKPEIASTLPPVDQMVETLPVEPETTTDQALDVEAYRQEMLQLVAEEEARDAAAKQKAEQEAAVKKSSPSKPQYPLRRDLPSNIRDQIPNLNVLVHVWSAKPQDRFVVLNSSRMTEGSRHNNGIKLIEIQRDGLLLEFSGERFIEPR